MTALAGRTDARTTAVPAPGLESLAQQLLTNPLTNRGTAFTQAERDRFGLRGLLPPTVETLEEQAERAWQAMQAVRRADPMYLGWRHERITGDEYYRFVDAFVQAVRAELPEVLLQWEDFAGTHAAPILDRYRDQLLTFNDDIQGTAAVVAGAMTGAAVAGGVRLREQRIVMLGAGSAGIR